MEQKSQSQRVIHIQKINCGANEFVPHEVDGTYKLQYL